ncbi:MAG: hypothetical protein HFJ21_05460 [Clostridia bacterium]|jgi:hypothetical protein|nr:hypothetical protein [Clostridia bacterium]MCI9459889.1 hypothetical protein [Clostridia bacterium]
MDLQQTGELANKAAAVQWVKWVHPNTEPAHTHEEKQTNVLKAAMISAHCAKCLNMNGCCFAKYKCPKSPLHENCHCNTERIDSITITTECPIEKFTGYIFNKFYNDGKEQIFKDLGFSISDSDMLKAEMEKQANLAYLLGNYELNKLNSYGQRLNIKVTLIGKNGKSLSFKTGWMTYPDGKIVLTTPFGGFVDERIG